MSARRLVFAALGCLAATPASAEPATIDPALFTQWEAPAPARELYDFGTDGVTLAARGRRAIDTASAREAAEEARAMKGFLPGYPQSAAVTLELRISY